MHISVAIPLYNKAQYIERALRSALAQTLPPDEVVVVDDGSTDDGPERAQGYPNVRVIRQHNAGPGIARDRAIRASNGALVALLDADDEWLPHMLETSVRLLEEFPQAAASGVGYAACNAAGEISRVEVRGLDAPWRGLIPDYFAASLSYPPLWSSSTLLRRALFDRVNPTPSPARLGEDQLLWCQLAVQYPIAYDSTLCAYYHTGAAGRACDTHHYADELPFVTFLRELVESGGLAGLPVSETSVRRFVFTNQLRVARALTRSGGSRALARALLRRACMPPTLAARWRWLRYWISTYLP